VTHAYIVLERAGTTWVLPRRLSGQAGHAGVGHNHVPFVLIDEPETAQLNLPPAEMERLRVEEAVRLAAGGIVEADRRYLVLNVRNGEVINTARPPQPPVQYRFNKPDGEDLLAGRVES
jgi:hypothetical protein